MKDILTEKGFDLNLHRAASFNDRSRAIAFNKLRKHDTALRNERDAAIRENAALEKDKDALNERIKLLRERCAKLEAAAKELAGQCRKTLSGDEHGNCDRADYDNTCECKYNDICEHVDRLFELLGVDKQCRK